MRSLRFFSVVVVCGGILLLFFLLHGCSNFFALKSKLPRFPEDHARFERIVNAIEKLRQAYVRKNVDGLRELMLPLDVLQRLHAEIEKDFSIYAEINLEFTIERMAINGGRAMVNVRWEGEWKRQATELIGLIGQGHGVLVWSGRQVILLADVDGDLPFGMATRESLS
jgi:hypothetical protein